MSASNPARIKRARTRRRTARRGVAILPVSALVVSIWAGCEVAAQPKVPTRHVFDLVPVGDRRSSRLDEFVARQIASFADSDPMARADARDQIRKKAWRSAVPALAREIRSGRARPRTLNALLALASIGGERAMRILRSTALDDQFPRDERVAAALALGCAGGPLVERTIGTLLRRSLSDDLRTGVALSAARLESRKLASALRRLVPSNFRPSRSSAAVVLACHRSGIDVTSAVKVLGRSNVPVARRVGCLIAADLADRSTTRMLSRNLSLEKNDPWSAVCALVALADRRPEQVGPVLVKSLASNEEPLRRYAALALGWSRDKEGAKALVAAFRHRRNKSADDVRAAIAQAMVRREDPSLFEACLLDTHPPVRAAGVLMARGISQSIERLDRLLARESDAEVVDLALTVRFVIENEPLPPGHRLRRARGMVARRLAASPWRDLDRYRAEPGAPVWGWVRTRYDRALVGSSRAAVKARLLNGVMIELLELDRFEPPHRRLLNVPRDTQPIPLGRLRQSNDLSRNQKDLKVWLERAPYFRP